MNEEKTISKIQIHGTSYNLGNSFIDSNLLQSTYEKVNEILSHFNQKPSFLPKPISEYHIGDIGSSVFIPYNDESGKIALNEDGCIEFAVVAINHHTFQCVDKDIKNTITIMPKQILRYGVFDAPEPLRRLKEDTWFSENGLYDNGAKTFRIF